MKLSTKAKKIYDQYVKLKEKDSKDSSESSSFLKTQEPKIVKEIFEYISFLHEKRKQEIEEQKSKEHEETSPKCFTVDLLIAHLQALKKQGYGSCEILLSIDEEGNGYRRYWFDDAFVPGLVERDANGGYDDEWTNLPSDLNVKKNYIVIG